MKKRILIALCAVLAFGLAAAGLAYARVNHSNHKASAEHCPMRGQNASTLAAAEENHKSSSCDKTDCCCKDGQCPMNGSGDCCCKDKDTCPMKKQTTDASAAQVSFEPAGEGFNEENCPQKDAGCCRLKS